VQAAAEEEEAHVELDIAQREAGVLEKRWRAVEREAVKVRTTSRRLQAEVESLRKQADRMEWSTEKEQASEVALRRTRNDAMHSKEVRVCPLLQM
jgi:hypothetical protein